MGRGRKHGVLRYDSAALSVHAEAPHHAHIVLMEPAVAVAANVNGSCSFVGAQSRVFVRVRAWGTAPTSAARGDESWMGEASWDSMLPGQAGGETFLSASLDCRSRIDARGKR